MASRRSDRSVSVGSLRAASNGGARRAPKSVASRREFPQGRIPLLSVEGNCSEAGRQLGFAWQEAFQLQAARIATGHRPWWKDRFLQKLIKRYAPYLPDLYVGMAKGAKVDEDKIGEQLAPDWDTGCTSFIVQPQATLDGHSISGQTKDTPCQQQFRFVVLRMRLTDAPWVLTLTYPGEIYGHGFVRGGCSIFRNSLYAGAGKGLLPHSIWGLLAQRCASVEEVVALVRSPGVRGGFHAAVADEHGGAIGIEQGKAGMAVLKATGGVYTHANAVMSGKKLQRFEETNNYGTTNSYQRTARMRELLEPNAGRLTAQLCLYAFSDHKNFPTSICRHENSDARTTSAVVVEPTKGRLHAARGNPCCNWAVTYWL